MTLVRFFRADGTLDKEVEAAPGQRLLDVAWAAREPLEGACEGVMACSTCHVIVDAEDFAKLPSASEEEEDLLDLAAHATRTSRLACQIILTEGMKSLSVRIPPGATQLDGPLVALGGSAGSGLPTRASGAFLGRLARRRRGSRDASAASPASVSLRRVVWSSSSEAAERGLPELCQRHAAVEVGVGGSDRLGHVEQAIARCALEPAA